MGKKWGIYFNNKIGKKINFYGKKVAKLSVFCVIIYPFLPKNIVQNSVILPPQNTTLRNRVNTLFDPQNSVKETYS